jgi:hypothetical protein
MTPIESIENRIRELDEKMAPIYEKLDPIARERKNLIHALALLKGKAIAERTRPKWTPELIDSIEARISVGVKPDVIAQELGMKTQTLYSALSKYRNSSAT